MIGRLPLTVAIWAFTAVSCVAFVADTMLGPILFTIDHQHGVHLGDVLACIGFPAWAYVVTRSFWLPSRRGVSSR